MRSSKPKPSACSVGRHEHVADRLRRSRTCAMSLTGRISASGTRCSSASVAAGWAWSTPPGIACSSVKWPSRCWIQTTRLASSRCLQDEARILGRLEHPGIVPVHDAGTLPDGRVFYVMKLVRGERLDVALDSRASHRSIAWSCFSAFATPCRSPTRRASSIAISSRRTSCSVDLARYW